MDDDTPESRPAPSKAQPAQPLTEAELSRIAREAVHQPADARLDKQLARMGLADAAEPAASQAASPTSAPAATDIEMTRLREELRRTRIFVSLLVAVVAVLVVALIVLLLR